MKQKSKYLVISLIMAGITGIVSVYVLLVSPKSLELTLNWVQLGCLLSALCCITDYIRKDKRNLFYQFQAGAVACFAMGQIFWVLHLFILGYDNETFSISDISWIGFYLFLISAVSGILDPAADDKGKNFWIYKIIAMTAPAAVIASGVLLFLFFINKNFGDITYVVLYTTVMSPLSYFSLKLLIIPAGDKPLIKAMRPYNGVILAILAADIVWTFNDFMNHGVIFYVCEFVLCIMFLLLAPAAYGGENAWKT